MKTLGFFLPDAGLESQRALSYSVLSAMKQAGDPGALRWVLVCESGVTRDDLPLEVLPVPPAVPGQPVDRIQALRALCDAADGPVCLVDPVTDFRADPIRLFERISPDHALMQDRGETLGTLPGWSQALAEAKGDPALSSVLHGGRDWLSPIVLGLDPAQFGLVAEMSALAARMPPSAPAAEDFAVGAVLADNLQLDSCQDLVVHYGDFRRHVYRGRLRHMFPEGRVADAAAMAPALPRISFPPQPWHLKLRARVYGRFFGLNSDERAAYTAYLCSRSAPTADGRNVWADIALDMIAARSGDPDRWRRVFAAFAPDSLGSSGLSGHTLDRWSAFWSGHPV